MRGDVRILREVFARDSMENLFFGILAFHRKTGQWPARVGVVSWNSKGLRYHLIASGMRLGGRIFFHGVGDYPAQADLNVRAPPKRDSTRQSSISPARRLTIGWSLLLRNTSEFAQKRWLRMPSSFSPDAEGNTVHIQRVKAAYGTTDATVRNLIDQIERLPPGDGSKSIDWPWS